MAQVKASELRSKTPDELKTRLTDLAKEAYNLRFQGATGELQNVARIRLVRREIARIKTVIAENNNDVPPKAAAKAKPKVKAAPKAKAQPKSAKPKTKAKKKVK